jgi:hypothetical protein
MKLKVSHPVTCNKSSLPSTAFFLQCNGTNWYIILMPCQWLLYTVIAEYDAQNATYAATRFHDAGKAEASQ